MRRALGTVAVLVGVQAALVAGYYLLGRGRGGAVDHVGMARIERLRQPAPELVYRSRDGAEHRLSALRGRAVIVHFWATWCPPCREELPGLLDYAASSEMPVLAVSVDQGWSEVSAFLGGEPPPVVVLASSEAVIEEFGVATLPQTLVIDSAGQLRLRFDGPLPWDARAVHSVIDEVGDE